MTGDRNQFSLSMPSFFRSALNLTLYTDGHEQNRWRITDPDTGKMFRLTDDEMHMMEVLSENLLEVQDKYVPNRWKRFVHVSWTKAHTFNVRDCLLNAIVKKRRGDSSDWDRFAAMSTAQWYGWLENVLGLKRK